MPVRNDGSACEPSEALGENAGEPGAPGVALGVDVRGVQVVADGDGHPDRGPAVEAEERIVGPEAQEAGVDRVGDALDDRQPLDGDPHRLAGRDAVAQARGREQLRPCARLCRGRSRLGQLCEQPGPHRVERRLRRFGSSIAATSNMDATSQADKEKLSRLGNVSAGSGNDIWRPTAPRLQRSRAVSTRPASRSCRRPRRRGRRRAR
jgi:hypothetical protein